jgi:predicted O-methyltransferase YrrM
MDSMALDLTPLYRPGERFEISKEGLAEWQRSDAFRRVAAFFHDYRGALQSHVAMALLYHLIVMHRPRLALEIGTWRAGTAAVMARALHEVGEGHLETIDPFGGERCPPIIAALSVELQQRISFSAVNSAAHFDAALSRGKRYDLVLVDGNHELEFARFDLDCAARLIQPNGLIVLDNIEQPGPRLAAKQFLASHPEWQDVADVVRLIGTVGPLDMPPPSFHFTKFYLLRAPGYYLVRDVPLSFGPIASDSAAVDGIEISLARPSRGTLHVQVYARTFGLLEPEELVGRQEYTLGGVASGPSRLRIPLGQSLRTKLEGADLNHRIEIVMAFVGDAGLALAAPPLPYPARHI